MLDKGKQEMEGVAAQAESRSWAKDQLKKGSWERKGRTLESWGRRGSRQTTQTGEDKIIIGKEGRRGGEKGGKGLI